jgi:type I restriction enzyme S subunit
VKLGEILRLFHGKAIQANATGCCPVYGSNGKIGRCDSGLYDNAIIIGRVGAYCGSVAREKGTFWASDNTIVCRAVDDVSDTNFCYYLLKDLRLNNYAGGTAQPLITQGIIKQIEIPLPPLPIQRRIADVLSAYDDLIENNRRRIAILEETARLAYRKWFNENSSLTASVRIGEFIEFQNGFAFKSNTFVEAGQYKIITIKNVKDVIVDSGNVAFVESIPARMPAHCRILPKDILLSLTGNVGRVSIAIEQNGLLNQRVAKVKSDFPWFSLLVLKSNECFRLMNNLAVGTAQQNLSPVKLCDEFIEVPTRTGMAHVERLVAPLFDQIVLLAQQNTALAAARDMLLPRLMKGDIM